MVKIVYIPKEINPPESNRSDLDCSGGLSWTDVEPGQIVNGSFQIRNVGNRTSLLNWKIDISSLEWGVWSCTPEFGENLSPSDGDVTVYVSVVAPNQKNSDFADGTMWHPDIKTTDTLYLFSSDICR